MPEDARGSLGSKADEIQARVMKERAKTAAERRNSAFGGVGLPRFVDPKSGRPWDDYDDTNKR